MRLGVVGLGPRSAARRAAGFPRPVDRRVPGKIRRMSGPRYAIYFAPEQDDPLARFGAADARLRR